MASSINNKKNLLRLTHLPATRSDADILIPEGAQDGTTRVWPDLTLHEIEQALLKANNTAPGADEISTEAIKKAWPYISNLICSLFSLCLEEG